MILPENEKDLSDLLTNYIGNCFLSENDRRVWYDVNRAYYLYGTSAANLYMVEYNMIHEGVDTLSSFVYSGESTIFTVQNKEEANYFGRTENAKNIRMGRQLKNYWHIAGLDEVFRHATEWAFVYDTAFIKLFWKYGKPCPFFVEPYMVGVLNEYKGDLEHQEVICHRYYESYSSIERGLSGDKNKKEKLKQITSFTFTDEPVHMPRNIQRIIEMSQSIEDGGGGRITENYPLVNVMDRPRITEEVVQVHEVWIWDDMANPIKENGKTVYYKGDFRKIVIASGIILANELAKDCYIQGRHPFVKLTPNSMPDYFWGDSEIRKILKLQDYHNTRVVEIQRLLQKHLDPPIAVTTMTGLIDEKRMFHELHSPGGGYNIQDPQAKVTPLLPTIPAQIYQELFDIREMVFNQFGLGNVLRGRGESGVRSRGQAELLTSFGSARLKKKAERVEDAVSKVGQLLFELLRRFDKSHMILDDPKAEIDGKPFIANQMEGDYIVRVDSHSASPIFVSEQQDIAAFLFNSNVIGPEALINLMHIGAKDFVMKEAKKKIEHDMEIAKLNAQAQEAKKTQS